MLLVLPVKIVGEIGPTASAVRVGLTKNPVQLSARPRVAIAPKAAISRSLDFVDDIIF